MTAVTHWFDGDVWRVVEIGAHLQSFPLKLQHSCVATLVYLPEPDKGVIICNVTRKWKSCQQNQEGNSQLVHPSVTFDDVRCSSSNS